MQPKNSNLPSSEPRRHHVVPQFLLRRFLSPSGDLFALDRHNGHPHKMNAKNASAIRDFYRLEGIDNPVAVEQMLSSIEGEAALAIRQLESDPPNLSPNDRWTLAHFMVLQDMRTPLWRGYLLDHLGRLYLDLLEVDLENAVTNPERLRSLCHDAEATDADLESERITLLDEIRKGRITVEVPHAEAIVAMVEIAPRLVPKILEMSWTVLTAEAGEQFVLSDTPLTHHDTAPTVPYGGASWMSGPMAVTSMPLGPQLCLQLSPNGGPALTARTATGHDVKDINLRSYGWAERWVYGASQQVLQEVRRAAKANPRLAARPQPPTMTIFDGPGTPGIDASGRPIVTFGSADTTIRSATGIRRSRPTAPPSAE